MTEEECRQFENDLMYAARETLVRRNQPLNITTYSVMLKTILNAILIEGIYDVITSNYGAKDLIRKYNNIIILEILCFKFSNSQELDSKLISSITKDIFGYVNKYVDILLKNGIEEKWLNPYEFNFDDSIENKISEVHFRKPTNECREAVLSGRQLCVSRTSINLCGMHAFSDVGKIAKNQEDSYYVGVHPENEEFKIMLVADGMGGELNGEKASNYVTSRMIKWFEALPSSEYANTRNDMIQNNLEKEIYDIHFHLRRDYPNSGTTLCMFVLKQDSVFICNIGDSKGYILENGIPVYATIAENCSTKAGIPDDFARFYYFNNILTNSIGMSNKPVVNCDSFNLTRGNKYNLVLCSDGVTDCLSTRQISSIIERADISDIAHDLVIAALNTTSSFKTEYNRYGSIVNEKEYKRIKDLLRSKGFDEDYEKTIVGGSDNATAVVGRIQR